MLYLQAGARVSLFAWNMYVYLCWGRTCAESAGSPAFYLKQQSVGVTISLGGALTSGRVTVITNKYRHAILNSVFKSCVPIRTNISKTQFGPFENQAQNPSCITLKCITLHFVLMKACKHLNKLSLLSVPS